MLFARRPSQLVTLALCLLGIVAVTTAAANVSKPLQKEGVGKGYGSSYGKGGGGYGGYGGGPHNYDAYNGDAYGSHRGGYGGGGGGYGGNHGRGGEGGYGNEEYGNHHRHDYDQSYYPDNGPFYFHNKHHAYDTHYCSVHGSFALAYSRHGKEYGKEKGVYGGKDDNNNNNYGKGGNVYGAEKPAADYSKENNDGHSNYNNGYGEGGSAMYYKPRYYTRQYCRYAAAASDRSCHFCCRVVARSSNTSPDEIVSAIFAFDPLKPTNNGAGFDDGYGAEEDQNGNNNYGGSGIKPYKTKATDINNNKGGNGDDGGKESTSIYQCVCCAPKHNNNYNNYDNY